jgi:hypothetical protein
MKKYLIGLSLIAIMTGCASKNHTAVVTVNDKDGLLNENGEVQIKPIYKKMYKFTEIEKNQYEHPNYVNLHWLHLGDDEYAVVKNIDNKYGIIGKDGKLKLKVIFDSIGNFFNGYAKVEIDKKYGLIDENFNIVVKPIYDDIRNTIDGATIVRNFDKNNKVQYGCLNDKFELAAPLDYDMIYLASEDIMRIEKDGLWGFMDTNCNIIAKPQYKYVNDFSNGMAKVQKPDTLWTYINKDGKEIERKTFNGGFDF